MPYLMSASRVLFCIFAFSTLFQVAAALADSPPLILANVYREGVPVDQYWASEKLDGVRAYWDGTRLVSRQGNLFQAPAWFIADFPEQPLDGELWIGRQTFAQLSAAVRRSVPDEKEWRGIRYMVFDLPASRRPFDERVTEMRALVEASPSRFLKFVEQFKVASHKELMGRLDAVIAAGGEGLMLRRGDSVPVAGRSDDLLKVKRYEDAEAVVVGYTAGRGKYAGLVGALEVETADGLRFRLGSGLTDEQRHAPPPLGSTVTFKYYGRTSHGLPRFASFLRIRPPE